MKSKYTSLIRFETLVILLIFVAFSLTWLSWGKLVSSGWGLPTLYKKSTNVSNTILFFTKKDSPHLASVFYIVPLLGAISTLFLYNLKHRTANVILLITSALGIFVSVYMYLYFMTSKIFKLANAGSGLHLLFVVSIVGLIWSFLYCLRKKAESCDAASVEEENVSTH